MDHKQRIEEALRAARRLQQMQKEGCLTELHYKAFIRRITDGLEAGSELAAVFAPPHMPVAINATLTVIDGGRA